MALWFRSVSLRSGVCDRRNDDRSPVCAVSVPSFGASRSGIAQQLADPRGRLHVIPACDHYVPLERPDIFNSILDEVIAASSKML
jgi:hypothetical protein